jgi:tight adherence protein B
MKPKLRALTTAVLVMLVTAPAAVAAVQVTPVERVPFPKRQYVVDLGRDVSVGARAVHVSENGAPVERFDLRPLSLSSIRGSVVLTIDASESMAGDPFAAAVAAARTFAARRAGTEKIGVVTFNDDVHVVQAPTASARTVGTSLEKVPPLARGTHIYDAVVASLALLKASNAATRTIVLLSDGADVGSSETLEAAIDMARRDHVRIFTIGLASKTYKPVPLRDLAEETGGSYFEAASAVELGRIYLALGHRLANQYLLEYQSKALPRSSVTLRLDIRGVGSTAMDYTAPKPSAITPFHRSLFRRSVESPAATLVISLLVALLSVAVLALLFMRPKSGITWRIEQFVAVRRPSARALKTSGEKMQASIFRSPRARNWIENLEHDLEIANADVSARKLVGMTAATTLFVSILFALLSPVLVILSLMLIPLAARGWVGRKLRRVRDEFAEQLPANLQVLASAMRAGHSLNGSLAVAVENAHEPSRRELRRAVNDDKLGITVDEALRRVADRMENRDLQQVALLSELQRSAGGNAAEVLDTVVDTIRERADVRMLVQTLTAQGRMARWVLTALPAAVALILWLMQPGVMTPFFTSTGGQFALVVAAMMTTAGSLIIQRMVDIEV